MGESEYGWDLCVDMNYGGIWTMTEYEWWGNLNHGWIWIMGGDTQKDTHTQRHTHQDRSIPWLGLA